MVRYTLKKKERLSSPHEFKKVYQDGAFFRGEIFGLFLRSNGLEQNRIGISLGKKVTKLSSERNRKRRLVREAYRRNKDKIAQGFDLVFVIKRVKRALCYQDVAGELFRLGKKAGILHDEI